MGSTAQSTRRSRNEIQRNVSGAKRATIEGENKQDSTKYYILTPSFLKLHTIICKTKTKFEYNHQVSTTFFKQSSWRKNDSNLLSKSSLLVAQIHTLIGAVTSALLAQKDATEDALKASQKADLNSFHDETADHLASSCRQLKLSFLLFEWPSA
jgi:hypothetical protein